MGLGPIWMGVENLALPEFDPRTVQLVTSHYTDYAIRTHHHIWYGSYVIHAHTNPVLFHYLLL